MKKIVTLAVFFFITLFSIKAQSDFRFGFQLSPTFSWMGTSNNKINGNGTNLGLKLGVIGEKYFRENYAIIGGLGFAFNQGGTLKHDIGGNFWPSSDLSNPDLNKEPNALPDGVNLKYGIQYVEIPFGLKMRTQEFGYLKYFAEIPVFTLGIRTQARGAVSATNGLDTQKENIKDDVSLLNLSWGIGGGLEYSINGSTSLVAGLFFQNGFVDITNDKATQYISFDENPKENSKGTIGAITLRLGVMF
ncbi:MAG TPA: PorT family protein [Saprospiraceae bacterium]|nr:PorT family protein [Saprospiraceae bacterium]